MAPTASPTVPDLLAYMRRLGWVESPPGRAGALWTKGDDEIGVPRAIDRDPGLMMEVLRRLALAEHQDVATVVERARHFRTDIARFRATYDAESISLDVGVTIIEAARQMLRSVATTAVARRSEIRGNFSQRGDEVVRQAFLGHTEPGSYVLPVLVQLPEIDEGEMPFERLVVRTLAQSLDAVDRLVVQPAREPDVHVLHAVVDQGVSSEFCRSLANVMGAETVTSFGAIFDWAGTLPAPADLPRQVSVDAAAVELLAMTADLLRAKRTEPDQVFTGPIVGLRRDPNDVYGWITMAATRKGRPAEVRVRLSGEQYRAAVIWHNAGRTILVEGQAEEDRRRRLQVESPTRCEPL